MSIQRWRHQLLNGNELLRSAPRTRRRQIGKDDGMPMHLEMAWSAESRASNRSDHRFVNRFVDYYLGNATENQAPRLPHLWPTRGMH